MNPLTPFSSSQLAQLCTGLRPEYAALRGKIGILGGSFDPPHLGHLAVAQHAKVALELNTLLFVPSKQNPLKQAAPHASDQHRLNMLALSIASLLPAAACDTSQGLQATLSQSPYLLCDLELSLPPPSYTVDLLRELQRRIDPKAKLYFLLGADNLASLPRWKDITQLFELAEIVPLQRASYSRADLQTDLDKLHTQLPAALIQRLARNYLSFNSPPYSSSASRAQLDPAALAPGVLEYIQEHKLYLAIPAT